MTIVALVVACLSGGFVVGHAVASRSWYRATREMMERARGVVQKRVGQ